MSFNPQLMIGTWYGELSSDPSKNSIFRVLDDLSYVSFAEDTRPDARRKWLPMLLWGSMEEENVYRLRPTRDHEGWTRQVTFDGETLVFRTVEPEHKEWRCRRLLDAEIPEWFESEVEARLSRLRK